MAPKKILQDIVSSNRRSIRDVSIRDEAPVRRSHARDTARESHIPIHKQVDREEKVYRFRDDDELPPKAESKPPASVHTPTSKPTAHRPVKKHRTSWALVTFIILIVSIGLITAAVSLAFSRGTIVIKPKSVAVNVSTSLIARENATTPDLPYQTITATDEDTTTIPVTVGTGTEKKATGTVTLYNNMSTSPQKLVVDTRLSDVTGRIYRLMWSVVIPGQHTVAGKIVPGSISVDIMADKPGPEYNATLADLSGDFKIVGFKGTPKYDKFYGRLTKNITGGALGKSIIPNATVQKTAEATLKENLTARLIAQAKTMVPKGYIHYDDAYSIDFTPIPSVMSTSSAGTATIGMRAKYTGYIFPEDALARAFARDQIEQFPIDGYRIDGLDSLTFKPGTSSANSKNILNFSLKGNMKIVGIFSDEKLKKDLAGVSLDDSASVIKRYSTIGGAYAKIFPVWMKSFPDSPDRITIEINN